MAREGLPLHWSYEVRRSTTALELVAAGIGLALLPRSAVRTALIDTVEFRHVANPSIVRPIGILSRIGQTTTASEESFKKFQRLITAELES